MISVDEFRDSYINEDINAAAINTSTHPVDVFIESAVDILQNDYSLINGISVKNSIHIFSNLAIVKNLLKKMI